MKLIICTIVLDGLPFLISQLNTFNRLEIDWEWRIAHGAAAPVRDTGWCKETEPRLSRDGTTEFLRQLANQHPRVKLFEKPLWPGKTAQINACLEDVEAPAIVMQVDIDELWSIGQLHRIAELFEKDPDLTRMEFFCRHMIGPNLEQPAVGSWGNSGPYWRRAWRMTEAFHRFQAHEPPVFNHNAGKCMDRHTTMMHDLWFYHYGYVFRSQLEAKEKYYGYAGAVEGWERLQVNQITSLPLKRFLPWVDDQARIDRAILG